MTPSPASEFARLLAPDAALWRTLLDRHAADASGHCAGCRSAAAGPPVWPCRLRVIAETAAVLHGQGVPGERRTPPTSVSPRPADDGCGPVRGQAT